MYAAYLRPRLLLGRQITTHARVTAVSAYLERYREKSGEYPTNLALALPEEKRSLEYLKDSWGNALWYETDGTSYLLVSYGLDGKPDGTDYRAVRNSAPRLNGRICQDYDADEFVSDVGWHRVCGK
jgi:hypothetical protein